MGGGRPKQAAQVGTDTAEIYAIAPEQLAHIIDDEEWEKWAEKVYGGDAEIEDVDKALAEMGRIIRQHGGATFGTGADGGWEVKLVDDDGKPIELPSEKGYEAPYGTSDDYKPGPGPKQAAGKVKTKGIKDRVSLVEAVKAARRSQWAKQDCVLSIQKGQNSILAQVMPGCKVPRSYAGWTVEHIYMGGPFLRGPHARPRGPVRRRGPGRKFQRKPEIQPGMKDPDPKLRPTASAKDGKKTGDGSGVGLFIPLPDFLAEQYPDLSPHDTSPPHVTFLYVGEVPKDRTEEFVQIVGDVVQEMEGPVRGKLEDLDHFVHPAMERKVGVTPVRFNDEMAELRWKVRDRLVDAGFEVADSFPLVYRPHVTLGYLDGLQSEYEGDVPQGSWDFDQIEIWGLPDVYGLPFGHYLYNLWDVPDYTYSDKRPEKTAAARYDHIDFKPPEDVAAAAAKGLEYRKRQTGDKAGLTPAEAGEEGIGSGVQRAVNLKNRDTLSPETIRKMRGFFSRHQKNKAINPKFKGEPWRDKGFVSWLLWGGDPGKAWVTKVIKQMDEADAKAGKTAGEYDFLEGDNQATDEDLWEQALDEARAKFDVWPSAVASAWAVRWYNERGGKWRKKADSDGNYMSRKHLRQMADDAAMLMERVDATTQFPDWAESKLTEAASSLEDVRSYFEHGGGRDLRTPDYIRELEAAWYGR